MQNWLQGRRIRVSKNVAGLYSPKSRTVAISLSEQGFPNSRYSSEEIGPRSFSIPDSFRTTGRESSEWSTRCVVLEAVAFKLNHSPKDADMLK